MKSHWLRILVSLAVSVLCVYLATRNVDWAEMKRLMSQADLAPAFIGMLVSLITFYLRGVRWKIVLRPFQDLGVLRLARWQIGGLLINNLMPLRMGELVRAYWVGHKTDIPKSGVLATIIVERLLDMLSMAFLAVIVIFLIGSGGTGGELRPAKAAALLAVMLALVGALWGGWRLLNSPSVVEKLRARLPEKAFALLQHFISGLQVIQSPQELAKLAVLSPLIWTVDIAIVAIVSRSLGLDLTWLESALVMVGLILGVMVPAAPGAAGTYEAGGVGALALMGYDQTLSFSFILLLHTFQFLFVLVLGIPVLIAEGFSPKAVLQEAEGK